MLNYWMHPSWTEAAVESRYDAALLHISGSLELKLPQFLASPTMFDSHKRVTTLGVKGAVWFGSFDTVEEANCSKSPSGYFFCAASKSHNRELHNLLKGMPSAVLNAFLFGNEL